MSIVLMFMSMALLLATTLLVRERRLRRALELLLQKLLNRWRNHETPSQTAAGRDDTRPPGQL
jgi:hypothetical protein